MAKILRVCNSELLPPILERSSNYVYFVYDKMSIYLGQNFYSDPFCIVEHLPSNPVEGILYITLDGYMKSYFDGSEVEIGYIESQDQLQYLKDAGTVYFMKAEYRYLDRQTRLLNLPFQNGSYQLSVNAAKELMIDENTIIKFNPNTDRFEIIGNEVEFPWNEYNNDGYRGSETASIITTVDNKTVKSDLKISSEPGNILKIFGNGLYAHIGEIATEEQVQNLALMYENYKISVEAKMNQVRDEMDAKGFNLTEESLAAKIMTALTEYEPTIQEMFENYDYIYEQLGYLRDSTTQYADEKINEAKKEIVDYIAEISSAWNEFESEDEETSVNNLTEEEAAIITKALEEARMEILASRELESNYSIGLTAFVITDEEGVNQSDIIVLPKTLSVISEIGSKVGYTYFTVSPEKEESNRYFYKEAETCPRYNEVLDGYIEWDGYSQLEIENGTVIYLVETDADMRAQKFAKVTINSRLIEPKELEILTITSIEGSTEGTTIVNISPALENGNMYMYKKSTTIPEYNSIISDDYKVWDGESEITADYDKQMITFVECTSDFHRAQKVGLVYVDLANELLKLLDLTTKAGLVPLSTIITDVFPEGAECLYYYSFAHNIPEINSYIVDDNIWTSYNIGDQIQLSDFEDGLVLVETDMNHRVKKAGMVAIPNLNNDLYCNLIYDENSYLKNIVEFDQYPNSKLYYYITSETEETITHLNYHDTLTSEFGLASDNTINIILNRRIVLAEVVDNYVRRFGIYNPIIEYAGQIDIEAILSDGDITVSGVLLDTDKKYYAQVMVIDDNKEYILNEPIEESDYIEWDGSSVIQIGDSTDITMIKVIITDLEGRIINVGKCLIS